MARHLCLSLFSLFPAPRSLPLLLWLASLLPISYFLSPIPVSAQILSDGTVGTLVTGGPNFSINGGTRPSNGPNLFHSFSQFSVSTGGSAIFNNAPDVVNIISRVTGGSVSSIDGLIQANGSANLFLINPAGIIFGPNASLNIGGSFIGSTANRLKFSDGSEFSAINPAPPLLTINVPIGLQMGAIAGSIQVQGGLQVPAGKTLALAGSQITTTGATLKAPDSFIELWAVENAVVEMTTPSWQLLSPTTPANWGTITLQQASLVDASGLNGGAINIRGRGLTLKDRSNIRSRTFVEQGKGITIHTTDFIELLGNPNPEQSPFSDGYDGIATSVGNSLDIFALPGAPATGRAGDVVVETRRLFLADGAWLQSVTSGENSRSGDVTVRATEIEAYGNSVNFSVGFYCEFDSWWQQQSGRTGYRGCGTNSPTQW